MRFVMGLTTAALCCVVAFAADTKFPLTSENSKIEFTGTKKEGKHDGGFKKLTGTATITGTDAATAKLEVVIETESLWSDDAKLTGHLKSPDFFDVKTNPTAKFVSTKVEATKTGHVIHGDLTINGKTKAIHFPAAIVVADGKIAIQADFTIDRTEFGMTYGQGKIDDKVAIRLKVEAKS